MRVAVVGGGFAGLAIAQALSAYAQVSLFDPLGIGGGASRASSGLLHCYGGIKAKKGWRADEALSAAHDLLALVPSAVEKTGILRLVTSSAQFEEFRLTAQKDDVEWWPQERCQEFLPGAQTSAGIFIRSGVTVRVREYLDGLWSICADRGAKLVKQTIHDLRELDVFDRVILATGASKELSPQGQFHPLKGQAIRLRWPEGLAPPPMSVIARKYLVMAPDRRSCIVGATFEHDYADEGPDIETACRLLLPPICELYPQLAGAEVLECFAGLRATTPSRRPIIQALSARHFSVIGFGAKGLLYHALFARDLIAHLDFDRDI